MAWAVLECSKTQVDAAGRLLAGPDPNPLDVSNALAVLNNWRSVRSFPLNTFQMGLRGRAESIYRHALVAQRLKRTPSIVLKLQRVPTMNLSRMQDIGGCRAVVATARQVIALRQQYVRSRLKHELVNQKNYLDDPQESGYRGVHLIYKYKVTVARRTTVASLKCSCGRACSTRGRPQSRQSVRFSSSR